MHKQVSNEQVGEEHMELKENTEIIFEHLIELPNCECVFGCAQDTGLGKRRLFLIFNDERRIYRRNSMKDTWDELIDQIEYDRVNSGFHNAVLERRIPCFQAW